MSYVMIDDHRIKTDVFWKTYNILISAIRTKNLAVLELALHLREDQLVGDDIVLSKKLGWSGGNGQFTTEVVRIIKGILKGDDPMRLHLDMEEVNLVIHSQAE